jgi:type I restriction enzyme M protein
MVEKHAEKVNFIWSVKEVLRDHYRRHQYGEVILPFCVLRRLDCVLEPTKDKVLKKRASISGHPDAAADRLAHAAGQPFYNTSRFTFETLLADPENITDNVQDFLNGFCAETRDALEKFGLGRHVEKMGEAKILYMVVQRFAGIDLHPETVPNLEMGYIYEELIRVAADLSNEEAGEHFTPREVIQLIVNLLFSQEERLLTPGRIAKLYDPACGTGGMLTVAEAYLRNINGKARLHLYGQEIQPESYAVCRTDMMLKAHDASRIHFGDSFTQDALRGETFDYMLANPPFGKDWKTIESDINKEHRQLGESGRFGAGLPPTSDGQLLFLQHMISKMRHPDEGGSRIGIVFNGSPLFSGDAGSGTSSIRKWIIESDWLEAIVGLPDQLFYNTGIFTYVWVVTNRKRPERQGYVQLIDARALYAKMPKSLGQKRNQLTDGHIAEITRLYESFIDDGERSKVLPNEAFGYRQVTVERPLRVRYDITEPALTGLAASAAVTKLPDADLLVEGLRSLLGRSFASRSEFDEATVPVFDKLEKALKPLRTAVAKACMVRDPSAEPVPAAGGKGFEPDPQLRDTENMPLPEAVDDFIAREVAPYVPDAWIDESKTRIGYEIPLTRHFYKYAPPRPLDEIEAEIKASQARILALLEEVRK